MVNRLKLDIDAGKVVNHYTWMTHNVGRPPPRQDTFQELSIRKLGN